MSTPGSRPRALVTGANRGIGLALCGLLAKRGYDVLAADRLREAIADAAVDLAVRRG
jgi:NAD(P)-dependent dehydrogenase (short-subunit alcohol dehydrogenase family)